MVERKDKKENGTMENRAGESMMREIKFTILKDGNTMKYIPLIKKMLNRPLSEIRERLNNNDYMDTCRIDNIDGLRQMNDLIEKLRKKGAEIMLYENDRRVEQEFLNNIIESHFDTERVLQEIDDNVIEQDGGENDEDHQHF